MSFLPSRVAKALRIVSPVGPTRNRVSTPLAIDIARTSTRSRRTVERAIPKRL
jgi:hypothetical protein